MFFTFLGSIKENQYGYKKIFDQLINSPKQYGLHFLIVLVPYDVVYLREERVLVEGEAEELLVQRVAHLLP